jgi:hypothetical protein
MKSKIRAIMSGLALPLWICFSFMLQGCGGGGGGRDGYSGSAQLSISAEPTEIGPGDRIRVSVDIWAVHPDGIMLKVFFPQGLSYVPGSASLRVVDQDNAVNPSVNESADRGVYVVFFFSYDEFGNGDDGELVFELKGESAVRKGIVAVDADVDDPLISNDEEFDIDDPKFTPKAKVEVEVI